MIRTSGSINDNSETPGDSGRAKKVLIAGAGPAGLTAAYELCKRNAVPIIFEKENIVGGHARTDVFKGYRFDIGGASIFHQDPTGDPNLARGPGREVHEGFQAVPDLL